MSGNPLRPISPDEVAMFHRDGAVLLKQVLAGEWLELLEQGLEYANDHPDGKSSGVGEALRIDQFPADQVPQLRQLIETSPIAAIVGYVLNSPVRFYMDQMFYKPAGEITPTPWHQDTCYYNIAGNDLVRAWACPDPVPRDLSIEVVRGSHRWNVTYHTWVGRDPAEDPEGAARAASALAAGKAVIGAEAHENWSYTDAFRDPTLPPTPDIDGHRDSFDILGWDYEPGDILLFHGHILHGAEGVSDWPHPRRAHASMWAGNDIHYLHRPGQVVPDPKALYDFSPQDGDTLDKFPEVFPVLWSPPPGG